MGVAGPGVPTVARVPCSCRVGQLLAERAQKAGVSGVTWPRRRGESYHGKRKALLDAMREAGLPLI